MMYHHHPSSSIPGSLVGYPSRPNFGAEMAAFISLAESLLAAQDEIEAVLQEVDAAAMCQLKAVSVAWCAHARRELCTRLCCR